MWENEGWVAAGCVCECLCATNAALESRALFVSIKLFNYRSTFLLRSLLFHFLSAQPACVCERLTKRLWEQFGLMQLTGTFFIFLLLSGYWKRLGEVRPLLSLLGEVPPRTDNAESSSHDPTARVKIIQTQGGGRLWQWQQAKWEHRKAPVRTCERTVDWGLFFFFWGKRQCVKTCVLTAKTQGVGRGVNRKLTQSHVWPLSRERDWERASGWGRDTWREEREDELRRKPVSLSVLAAVRLSDFLKKPSWKHQRAFVVFGGSGVEKQSHMR